jgi:hypothetical protein
LFNFLFIIEYFVDLPIVSTGQPEYYPERGTDTILACSAKNATSVYWQRLYPSQTRVSINPAVYAKYSGGTISNPSLTVHTVKYYDDGEYLCIGKNSFGTKSASTKIISGSK